MENMFKKRKQISAEPEYSTFLHIKAREMGFPVSGTFELTSRCNFNCKMCYIHDNNCNKKSEELTAEWWIKTGKEAVDNGLVFLLLTGGEPLIREDFPYIYTELKKLGLVISINSNGYLLDGKIADLFKADPPSRINVSLYGASDETYERFTGVKGSFSKVIKNIENIRSMGIDVRLNCSITPDNCNDMENIFNLAKKLDLHIKTTPYMYPQVRLDGISAGQNNYRLSPEEAAKCRVDWSLLRYEPDEFISRAKGMKAGISLFENDCENEAENGKVRCRAGSSSFWINKDGEMSGCGILDKGFDIKTLGFKQAWNETKSFTASIKLPKECQVCKYRHFCNVCAAVCYTESGDFSAIPKYVCRFSEETAKLTQHHSERLEGKHEN